MVERIYRCAHHFAVAGFIVRDGIVSKAAPILKLRLGMSELDAIDKLRNHGWNVENIQLELTNE